MLLKEEELFMKHVKAIYRALEMEWGRAGGTSPANVNILAWSCWTRGRCCVFGIISSKMQFGHQDLVTTGSD